MISKELAKKIAAYSVMAETFMLCHQKADAQTLYTNINPDLILQNDTFNLDLNNDGVVDFEIFHWGYAGNVYQAADLIIPYSQNGVIFNSSCDNFPNTTAIPPGDAINQFDNFGQHWWLDLQYDNSGNIWSSGCVKGDNKYLGLKVIKNGNAHYGWLRLNVDTTNHIVMTLKDYAINLTPNAQILAGAWGASGCPKPVNLTQTNITNHSTKLNWSTQSNAIGYAVQYRKVGTSGWLLQYVNGNLGFKNINGLLPNTNYEWKVRTICQQSPVVQSAYTAIHSFTTLLRLEDESVNVSVTDFQNELFIYPNPATNELNILADAEGDCEVRVYNMIGQVVFAEHQNIVRDESITLNIANLAAGTYEATVTGANGNFRGRFIKQ